MKRTLALLVGVVGVCAGPALAQPITGGANDYPRTDAEGRAFSQSRSRPPAQAVKITGRSVIGSIVARGQRAGEQTGATSPPERATGQEPAPCEYDATFSVEIVEGAREFTVSPQPDCTLVLDEVRDTDVVEPQEVIAQAQPKRSLRGMLAGLWEVFFPRLLAQIWVQRSVYQHIYSCGVACAGGIDGLTAQQTWMRYEQSGTQVRANQLYGWYCIAGIRWNGAAYVSNCQPPLEVPNAPMFGGNTGWRAFNGWPTVREWGPSTSRVRTGDQAEFDWNIAGPTVPPRSFHHQLSTETIGRPSGAPTCNSSIQGSWVAGPIRSGCIVPAPPGW